MPQDAATTGMPTFAENLFVKVCVMVKSTACWTFTT